MRKFLLFSILLLLISQSCFAYRTYFLQFYAVDANGQIDSVAVIDYWPSTPGIDTVLGEVNLYGQPYSDLDMRIIYRDTISGRYYSGLVYDTTGVNYWYLNNCFIIPSSSENIDLKTNFVPFGINIARKNMEPTFVLQI
ncbi:MAG: hypothetical protein QG635_280, partial [Bacteroidota bacterium]|nr:hypothetical protein [Bacteroidota bacterium]